MAETLEHSESKFKLEFQFVKKELFILRSIIFSKTWYTLPNSISHLHGKTLNDFCHILAFIKIVLCFIPGILKEKLFVLEWSIFQDLHSLRHSLHGSTLKDFDSHFTFQKVFSF